MPEIIYIEPLPVNLNYLHVQLFISCVSDEFGNYRDSMRLDFSRPNLTAKVQEDFNAFGGPLLEKLDEYIRHCDAVIHIVGDMTGSMADDVKYINEKYPDFSDRFSQLKPVLKGEEKLSYTQWEAYLAAYHGKRLFVVIPAEEAVRNERYKKDVAQVALQQVHLKNLQDSGYYNDIKFANEDGLVKQLYRSNLGDILYAVPKIKPVNLPYKSIGAAFKGRDAVVEELHRMFLTAANKTTAVAVHGLGGMGKTRLAVEYAWQHLDNYTALLFITGASPELLKTNVANLFDSLKLGISGQKITEEDVKYSAVINWLNQYEGWLLLIDNVDTPEAAKRVEEFFAELQRGYVLITTRIDKWSIQVKKKLLGVLDNEDATAFLLETTANEREHARNDVELAHAIADDVGCLALALEQARAYIVTRELSFEKYRKKWAQSQTDVLSWFDEQLMQYPRSVAITWQTSFNQLSAAATTLLNRLAWLAPAPVPKTLLEVKWEDPENTDAQAAWEELKRYSLATSTEDKKAFTIHKLVQDVTRGKMDETAQLRTLNEALHWLDEGFGDDATNVLNWPHMEPLVTHVLSLVRYARKKEIDTPTNNLLINISLIFFTKAQYGLAEPLMRRALEINEQNFGPNHPEVATGLSNLAQLLKATNRLQEAEPLMRRALEIDEQNFAPGHPKIALRINNLAILLQTANRLQEAEPLMRRALEIDEQSFGPNHPNVARDLGNLAHFLHATNRLQEAEPLIRRALEINEQNFGPNHPDVARDLNNLAQLLQTTNRLGEAEPLMRRALEIEEKTFGPDHPNIAIRLNNLAVLFQATDRLQEAEPLMRRALEIDERSLGLNHPKVAIRLNNLATLLRLTDRLEEAEPLIRRALAIDEQSFGPDHPNVSRDLSNLAQVLHATNRLQEAEPLMRRSLEIDERSFGSGHRKVALRLNNLAQLLRVTGRLQEAEALQKRSFIIYLKSLGKDHPDTMGAFSNYIVLLEEMGLSNDEIMKRISQLFSGG